MLRDITIRGLGVIDEAVLDLAPGLNVVTGETGAGKTMVVTGLGLLLGGRADSDLVRTGADRTSVEGFADLGADHPALVRAAEAGADVTEGLILARNVAAQGRSRAYLGGRSVPISTLSEVGERLVAVHGQADQWRLRSAEEHRVVLDGFDPDVARLVEDFQRLYDEHHALVGRRVSVIEAGSGRVVSGRCAGLDSNGRLVLRDGKKTHPVIAGQVRMH